MAKKAKHPDLPVPAQDWTSDAIWELVKERLSEHLKVLRIVCIGLGAVASILLGGIVALLALPDVRDPLVRRWIVDVDAKITAQGIKIDALEQHIDRYMDRIVSYSYSSDFQLSGNSGAGKRYYNMPFYKTSNDRGKLRCKAIYPNNRIKNPILINFNAQRKPRHAIAPPPEQNVANIDLELPKGDADLFDPMISPNVYQNIEFTLDSSEPFDHAVSVNCTILIIGPTRFAGPMP
jgi:hypothetical protein